MIHYRPKAILGFLRPEVRQLFLQLSRAGPFWYSFAPGLPADYDGFSCNRPANRAFLCSISVHFWPLSAAAPIAGPFSAWPAVCLACSVVACSGPKRSVRYGPWCCCGCGVAPAILIPSTPNRMPPPSTAAPLRPSPPACQACASANYCRILPAGPTSSPWSAPTRTMMRITSRRALSA